MSRDSDPPRHVPTAKQLRVAANILDELAGISVTDPAMKEPLHVVAAWLNRMARPGRSSNRP